MSGSKFKILCINRTQRDGKWQAYASVDKSTSGTEWNDKDTAQLEADAISRQWTHVETHVMESAEADKAVQPD